MPVDTAKKRKAAMAQGAPATDLPIPDGTVDAQDRAQLTGTYLPSASGGGGGGGGVSKTFYGDVGLSCYVMK